ncbi:P-loop containing nucleoside triphosphate hydrolase protein [Polyplosphaeria fusca]|uniref:small monomeric GTPase n=1 Tax=Polyplosphaeria fusca TaxID=682080 RepID=A0A9P4UZ60_9PLEO|nr:P-loop containing nucleoside triphosphate hydrolase protein [Polyplosphaeria fusca]
MSRTSASSTKHIVVYGEPAVGKTCFIDMLIHKKHFALWIFSDGFKTYNTKIDGQEWHLQLVDINSALFREAESQQGGLIDAFNHYMTDSQGFVLLYSITDQRSFEYITNEAYVEIFRHRRSANEKNEPYPNGRQRFAAVLVGTKLDQAHEAREVDKDVAEDWASSQGMQFFELDTHSQGSLEEIMEVLAKDIARNEKWDQEEDNERRNAEKAAKRKTSRGTSWIGNAARGLLPKNAARPK